MKSRKNTLTVKTKSNRINKPVRSTNLNQVLRILMKDNRDEGVITLSEFIEQIPDANQLGVMEFLKNSPQGDFIAGRRGHPSRFVFGEAQEKWKHSEAIRRQWRIDNGRNPETGGPLHSRGPGRPLGSKNRATIQPIRVTGGKTDRLSLQVTIGDQTTRLPLKMELVPQN